MISLIEKQLIEKRGSKVEDVLRQIENFRKGFPYLKVEEAATVTRGIICLDDVSLQKYTNVFQEKVTTGLQIVKFVPASGAASRMFKSLFEALSDCKHGETAENILVKSSFVAKFARNINKYAFYSDLVDVIEKAGEQLNLYNMLEFLLSEKGLNYGNLPKGLLKFHKYPESNRTPFEEHLVEGVFYSIDNQRTVRIHYTVSPEHRKSFDELLNLVRSSFEVNYDVSLKIEFSTQKPSTDTIAVDLNNEPFRNSDGSLLFRPAGHGALLENLNDIDADLVFIKNIDNVVPDHLKETTIIYKKALAGLLLTYQEKIFGYQKELNEKHYSALDSAFLAEASNFLEFELNTIPESSHYYTEKEDLYNYLKEKYNRPFRVCGMVENVGEPGGGPFWAKNPDGTISLQVVESSQIDLNDSQQADIAHHATHFNPVDLVCSLRNYKGEKFNLPDFTDPSTGFISVKSKDGRSLKAQELPGLWNGSMSNWNTLFVEVPIETFNPVKTVNDLLRDQHQ
jgi:hypothetical protein